ncbi:ABC transporter ATP-binding protein [Aneurinibacillus sp. Ricciae_BoGa-3]|uniref:ABC transporter ATP-binding protein n=1 Tax=Aneurinibacillus sp. Ricciae_BoGa-3 TaxID=3022697 RepID=UPI002342284E|nr:ABC transporter ATP-binding protein [Aneurinibacillus sp. Ricciae_BoGa-3]WCK56514.1 ABC transporter ATP-binding protein [Aneurinibacillus sp. Ricciae_BoGa-3]
MEKVLEVKNVTKLFKNGRGIQDVNFDIYEGDIFGFLGPNGAGKTTLMKITAGLGRAQSGTVKIFGYDVAEQTEKALRKVGCIVEEATAYEYISGYKNLLLASRFYEGVTRARIEDVLELVDLAEVQHEKAAGYSLGMKQRLGLACALLSRPAFVMLDEPTNGLDVEGTVKIREIITRLAEEEKVTFLISSHLIHEIEMMCNRIGIINNGKIIKQGFVSELLQGGEKTLESLFIDEVREERRKALL